MSDFQLKVAARPVSDALKHLIFGSPAWTRLEPQSTSGDPTPGIEARVHDPLWSIARQWQLGEFEGEDAGTPVLVKVRAESTEVTAWQAGDLDPARAASAIDHNLPLDPYVEREPTPAVALGLWQKSEAGAYLVELLEDAGFDARADLLQHCALDVSPPDPNAAIPTQVQVPRSYRAIAQSTPDGLQAAEQLEADAAPWLQGAPAAALAAAKTWLAWFRTSVAPLGADDAWLPEQMEHRFSVRLGPSDDQDVLVAPRHEGGEIDWHSFDFVPGAQLEVPDEDPNASPDRSERSLTMFATPLRFSGMPADRYWSFEDGKVHMGRLDVQPHDLARLVVAEFAMVYGNDWIVVPLTVKGGSFTQIKDVRYTTTFGEEFRVDVADDRNRSGRFRMFAIDEAGDSAKTFPGLFVPPTALGTLEGEALEEVHFVRDEMANLAWAIERTVQARTGEPRSRDDEERPINQVADLEPGAELQYLLQTEVPASWIPFVPISTGIGKMALRKGTMGDVDLSQSVLLKPTPLTIQDQELPREGLRLRRVPSLARAQDGSYLRWVARKASVGRGEGWSGLAFDGAYAPNPPGR
ncbi:MAG: hypothetical protein V3W41_20480 [Planctomycetota bacterium]